MKLKFKLIFIVVLKMTIVFTQCDQIVVTNPDGPINNSLPNGDTLFLNRFDWNKDNFQPIPLTNMQFNQVMLNLMDPQQSSYYSYIYNGDKMVSDNGWELLLLNTGTYPNSSNLGSLQHTDIPYIVLYNRYTSILRVFANYGNGFLPLGVSFDAVKVELTFDSDEVNGTLRLLEGRDKSLDDKTKVTKAVTIAKHPNSPNKWFSADFQLTYDPCICFYPSKFRLNFIFISEETLELHGRGIQIEQDLINGNALQTKDYLSNFDYTGNSAEGGMIMYKALENLITDYELKLEDFKDSLAVVNEYNAKIERKLAVIKLFKHVIIGGGNSTITSIAGMPWFTSVINYANDLVGDTVIKRKAIIDAAKKEFGKGFETFISKNFKLKPLPISPETPTASFSEMHFQGNLTTSLPISGPNFFTPGTYGSIGTNSPSIIGNELAYPIYNEPLGTFALLESPKLKLSIVNHNKYEEHIPSWKQDFEIDTTLNAASNRWRLYGQRYQSWQVAYQFKLAEELKYKFNSNLDIKKTEIKSAIVVNAKLNKNLPPQNTGIIHSFISTNFTTNLSSINRDSEVSSPLIQTNQNIGVYNLPNTDIDYNSQLIVDFDSVIYESDYFPINASYNNVYAFGLTNIYLSELVIKSPPIGVHDNCNEYPTYNPNTGNYCFPTPSQVGYVSPQYLNINDGVNFNSEIYLKLMVDIEFNTLRPDGSPNIITQMYTYKIKESDIDTILGSDIYLNLENSNSNFTKYPENLFLNSVVFNGSNINGCLLSGNHYVCRAVNNVTIQGDLSTNSGFYVDVIAGNDIYVEPESVISPDITLSISSVYDYSHPMPEASETYVKNFCYGLNPNAPSYKANVAGKTTHDSDQNIFIYQDSFLNHQNWDFNIYPNPTTSTSTVVLSGNNETNYNIEVTDMMGKVVYTKGNRAETTQTVLDLTGISKGVYFVKVNTLLGTKMKQLVIQ